MDRNKKIKVNSVIGFLGVFLAIIGILTNIFVGAYPDKMLKLRSFMDSFPIFYFVLFLITSLLIACFALLKKIVKRKFSEDIALSGLFISIYKSIIATLLVIILDNAFTRLITQRNESGAVVISDTILYFSIILILILLYINTVIFFKNKIKDIQIF